MMKLVERKLLARHGDLVSLPSWIPSTIAGNTIFKRIKTCYISWPFNIRNLNAMKTCRVYIKIKMYAFSGMVNY